MKRDSRSIVARLRATDVRAAERRHVKLMENTEGLPAKPFLGGTSLDVDRALTEIAIFSAMVACLPCGPGSLVLDLGAGPCWVSEWLQRLRYRTLSLDLAEDMLAIGRRRLAPGSWLCAADMAALPLQAGSVDAALCYGALHHVPEWTAVLGEIHRVLRDGGVLVLQEPGRGHAAQAHSIAQMEQFGVLEQDLPPRRLARACLRAGFSRAAIRPVSQVAWGRSRILPPYTLWRAAPRVFLHKGLQRLKAAIAERLMNLASPMHVVVASKGTPWADSRRPETLLARYRQLDCPRSVRAGMPAAVRARVQNTGQTRWLAHTDASGVGQVRLGVSLLDAGGRLQQLDFARCSLPGSVEPGAEVWIDGEIPPIPAPGRYVLRFDLVAEGVSWFQDRGTIPRTVPIEVTP